MHSIGASIEHVYKSNIPHQYIASYMLFYLQNWSKVIASLLCREHEWEQSQKFLKWCQKVSM